MGRFLIKRYVALSLTAFVAISFTGTEASDSRQGPFPLKRSGEALKRPDEKAKKICSNQSIPPVEEVGSNTAPVAMSVAAQMPLGSWEALYDKIMNSPPEEVINTPTLQTEIIASFFQGFGEKEIPYIVILIPDLKERALNDPQALWLLIKYEVVKSSQVTENTAATLKNLENKEDKDSLLVLGHCYTQGWGFEKQPEKGFTFISAAATLGSAPAQLALGNAYDRGEGIERDPIEAVKWWLKAAKQGNAAAQNEVAGAYSFGQGVPASDEKLIKWFLRSAKQGYLRALCELGTAYYYGTIVNQNDEEAIRWLSKAANQGDSESQYLLGKTYSTLTFPKREHSVKALRWWDESARQGHKKAQRRLGLAYLQGWGVEKDPKKAIKLLGKAADQLDIKAQTNLGCTYYYGIDVTKDQEKGLSFLHQAADKGYRMAQNQLGSIYLGAPSGAPNHKTAFWYGLLADKQFRYYSALKQSITFHRIKTIYKPVLTSSHIENTDLPDTLNHNFLPSFDDLSFRLAALNRSFHGTLEGDQETSNPINLPLAHPETFSQLFDNLNEVKNIVDTTLSEALPQPGFLITNLTFASELANPPIESPYMRYFNIKGQDYLCLGDYNVNAGTRITVRLPALILQTREITDEMMLELNAALKAFTAYSCIKKTREPDRALDELATFYQETLKTLEELKAVSLRTREELDNKIIAFTPQRNKTFEDQFGDCFK
jgi:TPR repeat protein